MIKPEQIPYEVMREIWIACSWDNQQDAREAIANALNAWPKAFTTELEDCTGVYRRIILPFPREAA